MTYQPETPDQSQQPAQPYAAQQGQPEYSNYGQPAPVNEKKTLSLWGLILGIAGLTILPIFLTGIAGVVLSGIGLAREPKGKTLAIWGLILSIIGIIWNIVLYFVVIPGIVLAAFYAGIESGDIPATLAP